MYSVGSHISSGAYTNNMKCMYTSTYGHIIDWIEFVLFIYLSIHLSIYCYVGQYVVVSSKSLFYYLLVV